MKAFLISAIVSYGPVFLFILVSAFILTLFAVLGFLTPKFIALLKKLADSFESEKVRTRLYDAIGKLDMVIEDLLTAESVMYKEEMQKVLADGKIEASELKDMASKLASLAFNRVTPDHNTLKNFLVGECLQDFVLTRVQSRMISWAKDQVAAKAAALGAPVPSLPMPANRNPL